MRSYGLEVVEYRGKRGTCHTPARPDVPFDREDLDIFMERRMSGASINEVRALTGKNTPDALALGEAVQRALARRRSKLRG